MVDVHQVSVELASTSDVLTAIGTFGAFVAAVVVTGAVGVRRWAMQPCLSVEKLTASNPTKQATTFCLGITNKRWHRAAGEVEAFLAAIKCKPAIEGNEWRNVGYLKWTHSDKSTVQIGPEATRTIDVGTILEQKLTVTVQADGNDQLKLEPGQYGLDVVITGSNFGAVRYEVKIALTGTQSPSPN